MGGRIQGKKNMLEIQEKVEGTPRPRRARSLSVMAIAAALLVLVSLQAACSGTDDSGTNQQTLATMEARNIKASPVADGSPVGSPGAESGSPVALPAGNADDGKALATSLGCVACHSIDGSKLTGPTWKGLYGNQVKLADGSSVTADEAYIQTAIEKPNSHLVEGYPPVMPDFSSQLTPQKVADLIAYIQTLK